ncbi:metallophosphoesterase [Granulicella rosea]|nr:metallophosphoesterase [Granulicella rosea]
MRFPSELEPESASARLFSRRNFMLGAAAASGLALYAGEFARHEIDVVNLTMRIRNLPEAFHGFRIVQISDIHLQEFTEPLFLERVIHRINSIPCDIVLLTGDYVCRTPLPKSYARRQAGVCGELLRRIACPQRYGILGNHDIDVGEAAVKDALETTGTPILNNRYLPIERGGQRIWLCGLRDPTSGGARIEESVPRRPDGPVIVMVHEPDYLDVMLTDPASRSIDLVLSGHSHGGQVRIPGLPPLTLPPGAEKYYEGLYRFGDLQLYVNRGIGTVGLPFRLFCPPEITVFTLQPHGLV